MTIEDLQRRSLKIAVKAIELLLGQLEDTDNPPPSWHGTGLGF